MNEVQRTETTLNIFVEIDKKAQDNSQLLAIRTKRNQNLKKRYHYTTKPSLNIRIHTFTLNVMARQQRK